MDNQHVNSELPDPVVRLWKHRKWVAVGFFLLVFVPGMVFLWTLPPMYAATATVTIPRTRGAVPGNNTLAFKTPLAAVSERVLSRQNLATISTRMGLIAAKPEAVAATPQAGIRRRHITVEAQRTDGAGWRNYIYAFTVTYHDWQPQTAAAVANRLARSYQDTAAQMQATQARQIAEALAARISEVGAKLDKQRARVNDYRKKHLGGLPQQQQILLSTISRLNAHLQSVQSRKLATLRRREQLLDQTGGSTDGNLVQLRQRLNKLLTIYTPQYPAVKQLQQRISKLETRKQLREAGVTAPPAPGKLGQVNAQLRRLRKEENKTRAKIDRYQRQLNMLPVTSQKLQALSQGYNATSRVYSTLLKHYEHARVTAATMGTTTQSPYRVLEAATAPKGPVGPKRLRFAVMAFILSLAVGIAAAYLADRRDTTFHSFEELRSFTSVPVLATVPHITDNRWHPWEAVRSRAGAAAVIVGICVFSIGAYAAANGGQVFTLLLTMGKGG